jgi:hypothetical protein
MRIRHRGVDVAAPGMNGVVSAGVARDRSPPAIPPGRWCEFIAIRPGGRLRPGAGCHASLPAHDQRQCQASSANRTPTARHPSQSPQSTQRIHTEQGWTTRVVAPTTATTGGRWAACNGWKRVPKPRRPQLTLRLGEELIGRSSCDHDRSRPYPCARHAKLGSPAMIQFSLHCSTPKRCRVRRLRRQHAASRKPTV